MSPDPWSKESIELPDDFNPLSVSPTNEAFITLSLKLIDADVRCCFTHWQDVNIPPGEYVITDEGDEQIHLYQMMKNLDNMLTGTKMVMERIIANLSPATMKRVVVEKAQEEHGVEFEAEEVMVDGRVVGLMLKPKDAESGVEEVMQWLNGQQGG